MCRLLKRVSLQNVNEDSIIIDDDMINSKWNNMMLKRKGYDVSIISVNNYSKSASFSKDILKNIVHFNLVLN